MLGSQENIQVLQSSIAIQSQCHGQNILYEMPLIFEFGFRGLWGTFLSPGLGQIHFGMLISPRDLMYTLSMLAQL